VLTSLSEVWHNCTVGNRRDYVSQRADKAGDTGPSQEGEAQAVHPTSVGEAIALLSDC
jgi:hypothetical protein